MDEWKALVVGGSMACPPEDSNGLEGMGCGNYEEDVLMKAGTAGGGLPPKKQAEIAAANNINGRGAYNCSLRSST